MTKEEIKPISIKSLVPKGVGDDIQMNTFISRIQHRIIGLIIDKNPEVLTDEIRELYKESSELIDALSPWEN